MMYETKIFLSGVTSLTMLLFIAEMGHFSQCTPMNVNKNLLSPEELFIYVFVECGKSPVIKFALAGNFFFVISYSMFSYYVLKWASVPSIVWFIVGIPLIGVSFFVIYYHHLVLRNFGNPLENESMEHYIEVTMVYCGYEKILTVIMGLIVVISFIYKKRKSKGKVKNE